MPDFGEKIRITKKFIRKQRLEHVDRQGYKQRLTIKHWVEKDIEGEGIYLGTRTLQNGERHYDSDYGFYFAPTEFIKAALVSPGPRANPIYVPLDAIESDRRG